MDGGQPIILLSDYHRKIRKQRLARTILADGADPHARVTKDSETLQPHDYGVKRRGRPRINWHKETLNDIWTEHKGMNFNPGQELNLTNNTHITRLKEIAQEIETARTQPKRKQKNINN